MKLYIRNMACESCKVVVKTAIEDLNLHPTKVEIGEVDVKETLDLNQIEKINNKIQKVGLEIVDNKGVVLIEKIKHCILEYVFSEKSKKENFSDYLSKNLKYEYNYLSNLFSDTQGIPISNYMIQIKIERAKEYLIFDDNLTASEIAEKLNYSSLSNFSYQFKKVTGFTPSYFKELKNKRRKTIQQISEKN